MVEVLPARCRRLSLPTMRFNLVSVVDRELGAVTRHLSLARTVSLKKLKIP